MSVALMLTNSSFHRTHKSQVAVCQTGKHPDNDRLLRPMGSPRSVALLRGSSNSNQPKRPLRSPHREKKSEKTGSFLSDFTRRSCRAASAVFGCMESRHMLSASITQKLVNKPVLLSGILAPSGGNSKELRRDSFFAGIEGQVRDSRLPGCSGNLPGRNQRCVGAGQFCRVSASASSILQDLPWERFGGDGRCADHLPNLDPRHGECQSSAGPQVTCGRSSFLQGPSDSRG
jgi:hypothetical protein